MDNEILHYVPMGESLWALTESQMGQYRALGEQLRSELAKKALKIVCPPRYREVGEAILQGIWLGEEAGILEHVPSDEPEALIGTVAVLRRSVAQETTILVFSDHFDMVALRESISVWV